MKLFSLSCFRLGHTCNGREKGPESFSRSFKRVSVCARFRVYSLDLFRKFYEHTPLPETSRTSYSTITHASFLVTPTFHPGEFAFVLPIVSHKQKCHVAAHLGVFCQGIPVLNPIYIYLCVLTTLLHLCNFLFIRKCHENNVSSTPSGMSPNKNTLQNKPL